MIWTVTLIAIGCYGLWQAPKHWHGWAICTFSELLWFTYALTIGSIPLAVMACVWFCLNLRGTIVMRRAH